MKCGDCKYYSEGRCQRYPPQVTPILVRLWNVGTYEVQHVSKFPITHPYGFCGEYREKELKVEE